MYFLLYLLLGAFSGTMGGMLGIGGGVIIVPALIALFSWQNFPPDIVMVTAVGSSLGSIIFTSASAMRAQMKRDAVEWGIFRQWSLVVVLGGFCSGFIAQYLPPDLMKRGIAVFLLLVALIMLSQWLPKPERRLPGKFGTGVIGFLSGVASALAGIAGGNIIVPLLAFFNIPMQRAAATASALGLPIASVGALGYVIAGRDAVFTPDWSLGYVHLPAAVGIGVMAYLMAPVGVAISHKLPAKTLKRVFGGLLFIVALRMLWSSF